MEMARRSAARNVALGLATALCLIAASQSEAPAAPRTPDAIHRAGSALAALKQSLDAMGIAEGTGSVEWETEGSLRWLNQGPTQSEAMTFRLRQRQHDSFATGLTYVHFDFAGNESSFQRATVLAQSEPSADLLELTALSAASVVLNLASNPEDLRLLDRGTGPRVIAARLMNRLVELELDAGGLPRSLTYVFEDDLLGDSLRRFDYLDYRRQGTWSVPSRVRQLDAGRVVRDDSVVGFKAGASRPDWAAGLEPRKAHAANGETALEAESIAPAVYFLKQHRGSDYNSLAVELAEGWMILETPAALGDGEELRRVLAGISEKPIIYAAATHHHDDHAAGISEFRSDPVTVLTSKGNLAYFRTMMAARRGFSEASPAAKVIALARGQQIGPVRFLQIDASPHVKEMLLFYLPEQRILFHSDLGRFNDDGSVEPARPQTCALWAAIQRHRLDVDRIYSGHGRPGTLADLRRAITKGGTACGA